MKLNKRYSRSIRSNLSFYVSSTVLTITTLVLFFIMNIAGNAVKNFGDNFFEKYNLEDANFATYIPISDDEISELEKKYDVVIERELFNNIETGDTTARTFKKNHKTDLYEVTVGNDVSANDEIVISEGYAVANNISVGDSIKVGEKDYTITGFFQRPDYLYMLENPDDSYKNITTFFLAYMTDDEFDSIGTANELYLIRYNNEDNEKELREYINENYIMRSYLSAKDNARILMVPVQADMFIEMSYILLCVLPLVAVALISIIISRKVKSEQKMIGTLTALGYKKSTLMAHYTGFAIIPGIIGGVFSIIISYIFAQPYGELCLADYEPMRIECHMNALSAVLAIVVPTFMYIIAALLSVNKLLRKNTVLLLSGNADAGKDKFKKIMVGKKISFRIKYALRSLIGNPARTFVVFLGIFLGSFIILLGYAFMDSMEVAMTSNIDDLGSFEYEYILNELVTDESYGGEPVLMAQMEEENGKLISIMGAEKDNEYLDFTDVDGNKANFDEGFYISSVAAMVSDINKGDVIKLFNPFTLEENEITIDGIIQNDMQRIVYTSTKKASELLGIDDGSYNVIMSDEKLDIPEEKIIQTIEKSDNGERIQTMLDQMAPMLILVILLGVIICVASIYVAVNMLVTESKANISMLKVLGYSDKKINGIVLRVNHILLPIGIIASIPLVFMSCEYFFKFMADYIGIMMSSNISLKSYIISIAITSASYFGSLMLVRHKVKKIDMVESLKDNRE